MFLAAIIVLFITRVHGDMPAASIQSCLPTFDRVACLGDSQLLQGFPEALDKLLRNAKCEGDGNVGFHCACKEGSRWYDSGDPESSGCLPDSSSSTKFYNLAVGNFGKSKASPRRNSVHMASIWAGDDLERIAAFAPTAIIVMFGTNDATTRHRDNNRLDWRHKGRHWFGIDLEALLTHLVDLPTKPIVFVTTPPPLDPHTWPREAELLADAVVPLIHAVARGLGLTVINIHSTLLSSSPSSLEGGGVGGGGKSSDLLGVRTGVLREEDGMHLNSRGSVLVAETILPYLSRRIED